MGKAPSFRSTGGASAQRFPVDPARASVDPAVPATVTAAVRIHRSIPRSRGSAGPASRQGSSSRSDAARLRRRFRPHPPLYPAKPRVGRRPAARQDAMRIFSGERVSSPERRRTLLTDPCRASFAAPSARVAAGRHAPASTPVPSPATPARAASGRVRQGRAAGGGVSRAPCVIRRASRRRQGRGWREWFLSKKFSYTPRETALHGISAASA